MAGFSLYVSTINTTENSDLCFHENGTKIPSADQTIDCSVHGRYVTYYNERKMGVKYPEFYSKFAFYELCEVKVFGKCVSAFSSLSPELRDLFTHTLHNPSILS